MKGPGHTHGWSAFETHVPGKWVLAGEHAVLKGAEAVALPHPELGLSLKFELSGRGDLEIEPADAATVLREMLGSVSELRGGEIPGRLSIESSIPVGAGLGSSAALCVAVTRWISGPLALPQAEWVDFATRLENLFHGKSSGMDIAVISAGAPVRFVRGQGASPLGIRRLPRFTFHDTGLRARTSECVARVDAFRRDQHAEGQRMDQLMGEASCLAAEGLRLYDAGDTGSGLERIAQAMARSQECFERWGLLPPEAYEIQRKLESQGARASKLTGAGGGGMVVALWD